MIKKIKITVDKKNYDRGQPSVCILIFLLAGIIGFFTAVHTSVPNYNLIIVILADVVLCLFMWLMFFYMQKLFPAVSTVLLFLIIAAVFLNFSSMQEELIVVINQLALGYSESSSVTEFMLIFSLFFSFTFFFLEIVMHSHVVPLLIILFFTICSPIFGISLNIVSVILLSLFQSFFLVINMTGTNLNKTAFSMTSRARVGREAGVVCAAIFLCLVLAAFLPVLSNSDSFFDYFNMVDSYVYQFANNISSDLDLAKTDGQISSGNVYRTGQLQFEVEVSESPSEILYLRGFIGDYYEGGEWTELEDETSMLVEAAESGNIDDFATVNDYFYLNLMSDDGDSCRYMNITYADGGSRELTPYYAFYYELGGFYYYEQNDIDIDWDDLSGYKEAQEKYIELADDEYTSYPEELLPNLSELCAQTPLESREEVTAFIAYVLVTHASYTLTPGTSASSQDILEYFLFESGQGYCVHFASVAALMYRMYGIPARYVSGYSVPTELFSSQDDGTYKAEVSDEYAHAWVEIFVDGYGWVPVEFTPNSDGTIIPTYPGFDQQDLYSVLKANGWLVNDEAQTDSTQTNDDGYKNDFWRATKILIVIIICAAILTLPLICRRHRLEKINHMSTAQIFALTLKVMRFGGFAEKYGGGEDDFAEKLSAFVSSVSLPESEKLVFVVSKAAYGNESPDQNDRLFVQDIYRRISYEVYENLNSVKKIVFRYIKLLG